MNFVKKESLTRDDIDNPARAYGDFKMRPQMSMLVAPIFPKKYEEVFLDLGLENVPTLELMGWYMAYRESSMDPEWESDDIRLQICNGYTQLENSPKFAQIKGMKEDAPTLKGKCELAKLSPQDVKTG